jgi:integrase/recombinase XerD
MEPVKTYKREPLTQAEANDLANACKTREERLVVWTLLDTGLRVSELSGLDDHNMDWQAHQLAFKGKRGKRRSVGLPARVQPLLEHHMSENGAFNMSVSKIQRIIKRVANQAKVQRPCSPHVLRHTFAVAALQKGVSLAALQRILGHDNLATTAIYLNLSNEEALREFRAKW